MGASTQRTLRYAENAELKSVWIPTPDSTVRNEPNPRG